MELVSPMAAAACYSNCWDLCWAFCYSYPGYPYAVSDNVGWNYTFFNPQ